MAVALVDVRAAATDDQGGMHKYLAIAIASLVFATVSQSFAQQDRVGQQIARWSPGSLDIHQISTGRGNSAFVIMPDGTTLLIDAGDAGPPVAPFTDPHPNGSRSPGAWIAYYIDRVLSESASRRLDYALITHSHADHMGGLADVARSIPIRKVIDRGAPDYRYPVPPTDGSFQDYQRFLKQHLSDGSMQVERIRVGRADQLVRIMAPRAYPGVRDVFATVLREPTRASIGARADQIKGIGHIVVRVDPGGRTYKVVVVDDSRARNSLLNPSTDLTPRCNLSSLHYGSVA